MKSKKKDSMQIKRPSLKGMKNTKYLGHFAQDKYMEKGHNLSGQFPMFREPSQLEMMAAANPFDASAERQRRMQQIGVTEQQMAQMPGAEEEAAAVARLGQVQQARDVRKADWEEGVNENAKQGDPTRRAIYEQSQDLVNKAESKVQNIRGRRRQRKFVEEL